MNRPVSLPMLSAAPKVECTECAKCCTYVAAGVAAPDSLKNAGHLLWYLYHPGVSVYFDGVDDWSVVFESRCRHLHGKLCGIYDTRPPICREFDSDACDVNDPGDGVEFFEPGPFLAWLAENKPRIRRALGDSYVPADLQPKPIRRRR